jgi:biopolymer transport protein ExbB/TolQ
MMNKAYIAAAVLIVACAFSWAIGSRLKDGEWQKRWDNREIKAAQELLKQTQGYRTKEQVWQSHIDKIGAENAQLQDKILSDNIIADAAASELHDEASKYATRLRRCTASATAATSSEAASNPDYLLAQLFNAADKRAGELARYADESRRAGLACERSYDAIR